VAGVANWIMVFMVVPVVTAAGDAVVTIAEFQAL
jgi:hypothetical protein